LRLDLEKDSQLPLYCRESAFIFDSVR